MLKGSRLTLTFQSTPPRGGRRRAGAIYCLADMAFQSTPPRGGRPVIADTSRLSFLVSIHAPARGATRRCISTEARHGVSIHAPARGATPTSMITVQYGQVSIHAPARGATAISIGQLASQWLFQSTPPRGGRHSGRDGELYLVLVSIHAPARGATKRILTGHTTICFNPRPRAGGDFGHIQRAVVRACFNPRPRAGGD